MSTNYLKNFTEGETIKASETNSNNQFLLSKISEGTSSLQATVSAQISNVKSDLETTRKNLETKLDLKLSDDDALKITSWLIPNYSAMTTGTLGNYGSPYTAPNAGYYIATVGKNDSTTYLTVNNKQVFAYLDGQGVNGMVVLPFSILVDKNDVIEWSATMDIKFSCFVPLKGVN